MKTRTGLIATTVVLAGISCGCQNKEEISFLEKTVAWELEQEAIFGIEIPETPVEFVNDPREPPGLFDRGTGSIIINKEYLETDVEERIYQHELAHSYAHNLINIEGGVLSPLKLPRHTEGDPLVLNNYEIEKGILQRMILEGHAVFVESQTTDFKLKSISAWPTETTDYISPITINGEKGLNSFTIHTCGANIIEAIYKNHGQKGIDYTLLNPPNPEEAFDIPGYIARINSELDEQ